MVGTGGNTALGSITTSTQVRFSDEVQVLGSIEKGISYAHAAEIYLEAFKKATEPKAILAMVPSLEAILKECGPSEVALLKSFTRHDINVGYHPHRSLDAMSNIMSRSLKVLDLSVTTNYPLCQWILHQSRKTNYI